MTQQLVVTTQAELKALIEQAVLENSSTAKAQNAVLGMDEAAAYLGIPKGTLSQLTHKRRIGYTKIGRSNKFTTSYLEEWIVANRKPTREEIIQNSNATK